jgi:hypothetical protein
VDEHELLHISGVGMEATSTACEAVDATSTCRHRTLLSTHEEWLARSREPHRLPRGCELAASYACHRVVCVASVVTLPRVVTTCSFAAAVSHVG